MSGAEQRTGAWMQRGTIISLKPLHLMPTFATAALYNPTFLGLYAKHLAQFGFALPLENYRRHIGDASVPGKGEILVWQPNATA
jgi:formylmethanofuran dehydrogenase subunit C